MLPGVVVVGVVGVVEVVPMQENDVGFLVVVPPPDGVLSVVPHPVLGHVVSGKGTYAIVATGLVQLVLAPYPYIAHTHHAPERVEDVGSAAP